MFKGIIDMRIQDAIREKIKELLFDLLEELAASERGRDLLRRAIADIICDLK
jgi:hypothetical protein